MRQAYDYWQDQPGICRDQATSRGNPPAAPEHSPRRVSASGSRLETPEAGKPAHAAAPAAGGCAPVPVALTAFPLVSASLKLHRNPGGTPGAGFEAGVTALQAGRRALPFLRRERGAAVRRPFLRVAEAYGYSPSISTNASTVPATRGHAYSAGPRSCDGLPIRAGRAARLGGSSICPPQPGTPSRVVGCESGYLAELMAQAI